MERGAWGEVERVGAWGCKEVVPDDGDTEAACLPACLPACEPACLPVRVSLFLPPRMRALESRPAP